MFVALHSAHWLWICQILAVDTHINENINVFPLYLGILVEIINEVSNILPVTEIEEKQWKKIYLIDI